MTDHGRRVFLTLLAAHPEPLTAIQVSERTRKCLRRTRSTLNGAMAGRLVCCPYPKARQVLYRLTDEGLAIAQELAAEAEDTDE